MITQNAPINTQIVEAGRTSPAPLRGLYTRNALNALRFYGFGAAILLYAVFGSPTPDKLGAPEIAIALLLGLAITPQALSTIMRPPSPYAPDWQGTARMVFLFCAFIPLLSGIMAGHSAALIARDLIALAFLFLPLLYAPLFSSGSQNTGQIRYNILLALCLVSGVIFAIRTLADIYHLGLLSFIAGDKLYYLSNSPLVLMSAIYLAGLAITRRTERIQNAAGFYALSGLTILCAFMPLLAMSLHLQRGSLGLAFLSLIIILCIHIAANPRRALPWIIGISVFCVYSHSAITALLEMLLYKTSHAGLMNMRAEEWLAVWKRISASPLTLMFGAGWGAEYASPAVGSMMVTFTHGFLSHALLKTGLIGTGACLYYLMALCRNFIKTSPIGKPLTCALLAPLLLNLTLYASFKSFDFGLLLLLIALAPAFLPAKDSKVLSERENPSNLAA